MLYRLYRVAKRLPFLGAMADFVLRRIRNLFWSLRPAAQGASQPLPADYIAFVESNVTGPSFTLVEVGAGDGRTLRELALRHPTARFVGVDIQKAAVAEGNRLLALQGIANAHLLCASCLEDTIDWQCDYLISRTALIYLNRSEVDTFLRKRLPQVRRAMLLQEIISLTGKTETSHFFANPLPDLVRDAGGGFAAEVRLLDYPPWKQEGRWSGADVVIRRT